jgi:hypothetical protein
MKTWRQELWMRFSYSFDTFHQLLIIVEVLWLQPVHQVGKQVVVAWEQDQSFEEGGQTAPN